MSVLMITYAGKRGLMMKKIIIKLQILFLTVCCLTVITPCVSFAADDDEEYVEIHSVADLYAINNDMSGKYILMEDLDLTSATGSGGSYNFNGGGWDPLGYNHASTYTAFTGTFDGQGHSITGLKSSPTLGDHAGLFACIGENGTVKDLSLGGTVAGIYAGTIAGENKGQIDGCRSSGSVGGAEASTEYAGGLAGYNTGTITNCSNKASVQKTENITTTEATHITDTTKRYSGGIAGYNTGIIQNSFNSQGVSISRQLTATSTHHFTGSGTYQYNSKINSYNYAGGIAGINEGGIAQCYNAGNIFARDIIKYSTSYTYPGGTIPSLSLAWNDNLYSEVNCGGISGKNTGTIDNCYNRGETTGSSKVTHMSATSSYAGTKSYAYSYVGGIAGNNTRTVRKCYNRGKTSSEASALGCKTNTEIAEGFGVSDKCTDSYYLTGKGTGDYEMTEAAMKVQANYSGWDFTNVWTMNQYYEYPYPQLRAVIQNSNKVIDSVAWRTRPSKINYYVGEELDVKGGYIRVYYTDGTSEAIAVTRNMVSGFDSTTAGTKTLTVRYRGQSLEYQVDVIEEPEISSVEEAGTPEQTEFVKNTEPDYTGWKLQVNYVDDTSRLIEVTPNMVSGVDNTSAGTYTAVCTYKDYTFEHDVIIVPLQVTGIRITRLPARTTYIKGEAISFDRLKVVLQYNDGSAAPTTDFTISDYDPEMIGIQTIVVSYDAGENTFTDQFELTIEEGEVSGIAITTRPTKTQYVKGQSFDPTGMVVTATYTTGFSQTVTDYTCSALTESLGEQTIMISYKGQTADLTVNVIDRVLQEITIAHLPNKTQYAQDQEPDKTGLRILASFNDGSREDVNDYTLSGFNTRTLGTKTVTVAYQGKTAEFTIKVTQAEVTSLEVTSEPEKTSYLTGEPLDLTGIVVKANYNNGKSEEITDYQVDGFDGTLGLNMLTISYDGIECNLPVYVHTADDEWVVVEAPSCTTAGRKVKYCTDCGEEAVSEVIDATGHDFNDWEIINDSSCTEEGFKKHTCRTCSFTETVGIDKKEHDWYEEFTIDSEPTCVLDGSKSIHCRNCEAVKDSTVIRASGHDYTGWTITKAATCTEKGEVERECKVCHVKETMETQANNHDWKEEYTIDTPATCTEVGSKSIHCKNCDVIKDGSTEEIAAKGHSYGSWETISEPTCTAVGSKERVCSRCGDKETASIPATDHKWSDKPFVDTEPTCTEAGEKSLHCKVCGVANEESKTSIDALGHDYIESVVEPTCSQSGYTIHVCTRCGDSYTDHETAANNHSFGYWITDTDSTCTAEGIQHRTCTECGYTETKGVNKKDHTFSDVYTIDKAATCTTDGSKSYHCTADGCTATTGSVVIPAEGHKYTGWTETKVPSCTEDGDAVRLCTECGAEETIHFDARGHLWMKEPSVDKAPTCAEEGSRSIHCAVCGASDPETVESIDKLAHSWNSGEITSPPTAESEGVMTFTCESCHTTKTESIPNDLEVAKAAALAEIAALDPSLYSGEEKEQIESIKANVSESIDGLITVEAIENFMAEDVRPVVAAQKTNIQKAEDAEATVNSAKTDAETAKGIADASKAAAEEAAKTPGQAAVDAAEQAKKDAEAAKTAAEAYKKAAEAYAAAAELAYGADDEKTRVAQQAATDAATAAESAATAASDADAELNNAKTNKESSDKKAAAEAKARKIKTVTVNVATVNAKAIDKVVKKAGGSEKYVTKIVLGKKVKKVSAKAFVKYKKVKNLELKTKALKAKTVKGSLRGSKIKTVSVKIGTKKVNKNFVKTYKKIFTAKNAGKKVTVK